MATNQTNILKVKNLKIYFDSHDRLVKAVDNITFHVKKGEIYGIVGESGSGKSTTARSILKLIKTTAGHIFYNDIDITAIKEREFRKYRKELQMIFQDPVASLDPKKRIGETIVEALKIHKLYSPKERIYRAAEALERVGLSMDHFYKYPQQVSGGQAQRINIARALAIGPSVLLSDEPVAALDVSIQAQVINLLLDLKNDLNLSQIFISHDLGVVKFICDRVGTMYKGKLIEEAPTDTLFAEPLHPYTKNLMEAIPNPDPDKKRQRLKIEENEIGGSFQTFTGCKYYKKCPLAKDICKEKIPSLIEYRPDHYVACHLYQ